MTHPNPSTALASVVVDELARGGATSLLASPGSRSTSLVLAASAHPMVDLIVAIDERSASFNALGRAKATGRPAVAVTTSGTAVANLLPAVVEADLSDTPLVVVTADRPSELRGVGANQAIDQTGIFGRFVRREIDTGPAEPRPEAAAWWRSMVSNALGAAAGFGSRPGPVHLNVPFREPTVPVSDDGRSRDSPFPHATEGRAGGRPWTEAAAGRLPDPDLVDALATRLDGAARGLIIAGSWRGRERIVALGRHLGWPVLATAESTLRGHAGVIATGHHLVEHARPDLVLRFGPPGSSGRILGLVESDVDQIVVASAWSDPGRAADLIIDTDPGGLASALIGRVAPRQEEEWAGWWRDADEAVRRALEPELGSRFGEPAIAAAVGNSDADILAVASSMPIRDIESYAFRVPRVISNRGASGIDGFVSTALGASAGVERPLALAGDISFLHDSNGFLTDPPGRSVFVVVDNEGGGIFSFLPQAMYVGADFERLFATPHHRDLAELADFHGVGYREVDSVGTLRAAIEEAWTTTATRVIVARTDRQHNVAEHDRLAQLADEAVRSVSL